MKSHMAMDLAAELHIVRSTFGSHLFVVDGSRIYDVESNAADHIEERLSSGILTGLLDEDELWTALGLF